YIPEDQEFSDSSFEEDGYESPNEFDNDYESPTAENEDDDESGNGDYEPPPANNEDAHPPICLLKPNLASSNYADREFGSSIINPPEPPKRPGPLGYTANRGHTFPGNLPSPNQENRISKAAKRKKPSIPGKIPEKLPSLIKPPVPTERNSQPFERKVPSPRHHKIHGVPPRQYPLPAGSAFSSNTFPPRPTAKNQFIGLPVTDGNPPGPSLPPSKPGNMNRSFSEGTCNGRPPAPIPTTCIQPAIETEHLSQDQWYSGGISRPEAEKALRSINRDGTFLVRNSSKSTASHPYVLMVLYKNKVYNIQIRHDQANSIYMLGSGLRGQETFDSVAKIIDYYQTSPLLLIDGKDQSSRQNCILTFAAGCCLT
ncbi:hypothetical protein GDO86_005405, partial [Hymenochirus boettgeri]